MGEILYDAFLRERKKSRRVGLRFGISGWHGKLLSQLQERFAIIRGKRGLDEAYHFRIIARLRDHRTAIGVAHQEDRPILQGDCTLGCRDIVD